MTKWTPNQLLAIETRGCNIIVSAGAGSGKTAVLTERILRILLSGVSLSSLIVLTFTEAAAKEMKRRIKEKILETPSLAPLANEVDNAIITTFDAYALSLVKKYHYILLLPNDIKIAEAVLLNFQLKLELDKIFDEYYAAPSSAFATLMSCFSIKDDEGIKQELIDIYHCFSLLPDIEEHLLNYDLNYPLSRLGYSLDLYKQIFINGIFDNLKVLLASLLEYADQYPKLAAFEEILNNFFSLTSYEDIKNNIPKLPNAPSKADPRVGLIKKAMTDNLTTLKKITRYEDEKSIEEILLIGESYQKIIHEILLKLHYRFSDFKREYNLYNFSDIAKLAIKLVRDHEDIRNEIKNNTSEILVDEYQDTSDLQEVFLSYIARDNLYMVGDVKQSIYRFRNANPKIFKDKYDAYKKGIGGIKIDLTDNFRSRPEVVEAINMMFTPLMVPKQGGIDYSADHIMKFGNKRYLNEGNLGFSSSMVFMNYQFNPELPYSKEEIEIFAIARDIQEKIKSGYQVLSKDGLRPCQYSDFCILLEKKKNFLLFKQVFDYLEIPLHITSDQEITSDTLIHLISSLLNLFAATKLKRFDDKFRFAYTSVARSFLFCLSDEEIFVRLNDLSDDSIIKLLDEIDVDLASISNRELLEVLLASVKFYELLPHIGNVDKILTQIEFIDGLASTIGQLHYHGLAFIEYLALVLESKFEIKIDVKVKVDNSVRIMTIHKSKGLEFPFIYLANLYSRFYDPDAKKKFLFCRDYGLISPYYQDGIGSTPLKALYKYQESKDEMAEKIRLLYVAVTRAKERLIVVGQLDEEKEIDAQIENFSLPFNSLEKMFLSLKNILAPFVVDLDISALGIDTRYKFGSPTSALTREDANHITYKQLDVTSSEITKGRISKVTHQLITPQAALNLLQGNEIHQCLEFLNFKNPNLDFVPSKFRDKIEAFLASDLLKNVTEATIYKEHPFIFVSGDSEYQGIIDLLLEYDDHFDLIDYKLKNIDDEAYEKQLGVYRSYLNSVSSKPVNMYLYSLVDKTYKKIEVLTV